MRALAVWTCLFACAGFGGLAACSSDDTPGEPADSGTGSNPDASKQLPDAASTVADAALADADVEPADAAPLPDAAIEQCGRIRCDCTFEGIQLFGRVEYVTAFADVQVRESAFPDLRVREGSFPDSCGEWEIVEAFPDFTVEIVTAFEDFSIEYSSFPGIP
jgi:hypothetical protein